MKTLRQVHLYLGCLFAPMIIYFALSGAWQVYRFNNVPKTEPASGLRSFFHELSKPHTDSTLPGKDPKGSRSGAFNIIALLMALGLIVTTSLGLTLAFRFGKNQNLVWLAVTVGVALPLLLLFIK
jgi:CDP-diglyceride synthetase